MTLSYQNFIDKILDEKGISGLEPEVLDQMRQDLQSRLDNWLNARILEKVPEDKLKDFEELLDKGVKQDELLKFVEPYIGNQEVFLASVLSDFRTAYLLKG